MEPSFECNGKRYNLIRQNCEYCRNANNMSMGHNGYFICVPRAHAERWRRAIEEAIQRKIKGLALNSWARRLASGTLRVSLEHLVLIENKFPLENPIFVRKPGMCSLGGNSLVTSCLRWNRNNCSDPEMLSTPLCKPAKQVMLEKLTDLVTSKKSERKSLGQRRHWSLLE